MLWERFPFCTGSEASLDGVISTSVLVLLGSSIFSVMCLDTHKESNWSQRGHEPHWKNILKCGPREGTAGSRVGGWGRTVEMVPDHLPCALSPAAPCSLQGLRVSVRASPMAAMTQWEESEPFPRFPGCAEQSAGFQETRKPRGQRQGRQGAGVLIRSRPSSTGLSTEQHAALTSSSFRRTKHFSHW